jgi:hypothetical protein
MVCPCGVDEFVEQRLIRPAGLPSPDESRPMRVRARPRYRYVCADCGTPWGETPRKKPGPKPRTKN